MKYEKKVVFCQWEPFGEVKTMYYVRQKKHWWSRWKFIKENGIPRLFTPEEISNLKTYNNEKTHLQAQSPVEYPHGSGIMVLHIPKAGRTLHRSRHAAFRHPHRRQDTCRGGSDKRNASEYDTGHHRRPLRSPPHCNV